MRVKADPAQCDVAAQLDDFNQEQRDDNDFEQIAFACPAMIGNSIDRAFVKVFTYLQPVIQGAEPILDRGAAGKLANQPSGSKRKLRDGVSRRGSSRAKERRSNASDSIVWPNCSPRSRDCLVMR